MRAFVAESNLLNTDARSVIACLDWAVLADEDGPFAGNARGSFGAALRDSYLARDDKGECPLVELVRWLTRLRVRCALRTRVLGIPDLRNWVVDKDAIREKRKDVGFAVRQFRVVALGREVTSWDQPLVHSTSAGRVTLACQRRGGTLRFLLKASHEIGFLEAVQLSSSLCAPPGQVGPQDDPVEAELSRRIDGNEGAIVRARCRQSEEGGRFYRDENEYEVVELDETVALPESECYRWATLGQVKELIRTPGLISIELRAALTLLLAHL